MTERLSKLRSHRVCSEQLVDARKRLLPEFSKYKFGGQLWPTNMVARWSFRAILGNRANGVVKAWGILKLKHGRPLTSAWVLQILIFPLNLYYDKMSHLFVKVFLFPVIVIVKFPQISRKDSNAAILTASYSKTIYSALFIRKLIFSRNFTYFLTKYPTN